MMDMEWAKSQLQEARVQQSVSTSTIRLLELWDTMIHTEQTAKETVEVFSKLALGHVIAEQQPMEGTWVQVTPGFIKVADTVRVRSDAFTGDIGSIHNGRVGRVVAIRSGDVIINSTDGRNPKLEGTHYSPYHLEKLVVTP